MVSKVKILSDHEYFMRNCLRLANKAQRVNPCNLRVGCTIVKNGKIIGEGYFDSAVSSDHAEVQALKATKTNPEGATVYINLEPCFHYGKTPPCVDSLIKAKIKEVVVPFIDPNPCVNGKSINKLKENGINVTLGVLVEECWQLNESFLYLQLTKKPLVTAKWAASLDGKLATYSNDSKWITSEDARKQAHVLRSTHQAILIGSNTLEEDNPKLNVRYNIKGNSPIKIVLARNANKINCNADLWKDCSTERWLIIPKSELNSPKVLYLIENGVKIKPLEVANVTSENNELNPKSNNIFTLNSILKIISQENVSSLLIEGGPLTLSYAMQSRLITKIELFLAPILIGGHKGIFNFQDENFSKISQAEKFSFYEHINLGDTIWIRAVNTAYQSLKSNFITQAIESK